MEAERETGRLPGTPRGASPGPARSAAGRTAYDSRERLRAITGWSDDDLRALPIYQGEQLELGEVYFNLNLPEAGPFRAGPGDRTYRGYLYVAKGQVPDHLWLRLIDGWGADLPMGNLAPTPGAFGAAAETTRAGRSDLDALSAGGTPAGSSERP